MSDRPQALSLDQEYDMAGTGNGPLGGQEGRGLGPSHRVRVLKGSALPRKEKFYSEIESKLPSAGGTG